MNLAVLVLSTTPTFSDLALVPPSLPPSPPPLPPDPSPSLGYLLPVSSASSLFSSPARFSSLSFSFSDITRLAKIVSWGVVIVVVTKATRSVALLDDRPHPKRPPSTATALKRPPPLALLS